MGFTGDTGAVGCVCGCSSVSTMRFHPAEQLGEHHAGSAGCLASIGSGGTSGTTLGGELFGALAQAASSTGSSITLSERSGGAGSCGIGDPLLRLETARSFGEGCECGVSAGLLDLHTLSGQPVSRCRGLVPLPGAPAQRGSQRPDPDGHDAQHGT